MSLPQAPASDGSTALTRQLGRSLPLWLSMLTGGLLLLISCVMLILATTALIGNSQTDPPGMDARFGAMMFFALPGLLFLFLGVRLAFKKPREHRALLSPHVCHLLCAAFLTIGVSAFALRLKGASGSFIDSSISLLSSMLLALLCYWAGKEAASKGRGAT